MCYSLQRLWGKEFYLQQVKIHLLVLSLRLQPKVRFKVYNNKWITYQARQSLKNRQPKNIPLLFFHQSAELSCRVWTLMLLGQIETKNKMHLSNKYKIYS